MAGKRPQQALRGAASNYAGGRSSTPPPRVRPSASSTGNAGAAVRAAAAAKPSDRAFGSSGATVRTPSKNPVVRQAAQSISQAYINSKPKNPRLKGR